MTTIKLIRDIAEKRWLLVGDDYDTDVSAYTDLSVALHDLADNVDQIAHDGDLDIHIDWTPSAIEVDDAQAKLI